MTENLIIDGVDHAKFDLEWVLDCKHLTRR